MKRILFVCSLICVLCFTSVMAEGNIAYVMNAEEGLCNPCMYVRGNRYEAMDGFYPYSTTDHRWRYCYHAVCFECGSTSISYDWGIAEPHSWEYTSDAHVSNTLEHAFYKRCTVCGTTRAEYRNCPGPQNGGCILLMPGVNNVDELESE